MPNAVVFMSTLGKLGTPPVNVVEEIQLRVDIIGFKETRYIRIMGEEVFKTRTEIGCTLEENEKLLT